MKTLLLLLAFMSFALVSCDFGNGDAATNPPVTEPQDTSLPTKTDNTAVESPQEVPVVELPANAKRQDLSSQGVSVMVAPGMKVEDLETFVLVCSDEVVKDAKCFTLERYNQVPSKEGLTAVSLKGRPFYYGLKTASNNNKELEGYLQLSSSWYLVKATDADPTWIFPYLAHVELKGSI